MIFGRHELYLYFETRAYSLHYEKFADGTVKEIEVPYELPAGWEWARLTTANKSILAGGDKPKEISNFQTSQFPVPIFSNGVKNNGLYGWGKKAKIFENSVTISARGTIGHTVVRTIPYIPIVRLISVIPFSKKIDIHFLKYMITYMVPSGEGTSIPQLTVPNIKQFLVAVPPYKEQLRIVNVINKQFRLLKVIDTEQNSLQQLATQLKQKVLDIAMQGKLVPQDPNDEPASVLLEKIRAEKQRLYEEGKIKKKDLVETEIVKDGDNAYYGKLPESWVSTTIGAIISKNIGGGTPSKQNPNYWNGNIPWASVKDINSNYLDSTKDSITQEGLANSSANLIPTGTAIIATRMSLDKIVINTIPVAINQDLRALFFENKTLRDYFINIYPRFKFKSTGTTVKGISLPVLNSHNFPLPGTDEQTRINTKLTQVTGVIDNLTT